MSTIFRPGLVKSFVGRPCTPEGTQQALEQLKDIVKSIEDAPIVLSDSPVGTLPVFNERTAQLPNVGAAGVFHAVAPVIVAGVNLVVPAAVNNWVGWIKAFPCADANGNHPKPVAVWMRINGRPGYTIDIPDGTVMSYGFSSDGTRVILSDVSAASGGGSTTIIVNGETVNTTSLQFWVKAQNNWTKSGTCNVKLLTGYGGSEVGSAFFAKLRGEDGFNTFAWNVIKGGVYRAIVDTDGEVTIVDPAIFDRPIGTVEGYMFDPRYVSGSPREFYESMVNKAGWGAGDGVGNGAGFGGSGIDWTTYFMNAKVPTGAIGNDVANSDKYAAASHTHGVSINGRTLTLSISDHPPHVHYMGHLCNTACITGSAANYWTDFADEHDDSGQKDVWTGPPQSYFSSAHDETDHVDLTLSHSGSLSPNPHDHTVSESGSHSDPKRFECFWVERLDNSNDTIGI